MFIYKAKPKGANKMSSYHENEKLLQAAKKGDKVFYCPSWGAGLKDFKVKEIEGVTKTKIKIDVGDFRKNGSSFRKYARDGIYPYTPERLEQVTEAIAYENERGKAIEYLGAWENKIRGNRETSIDQIRAINEFFEALGK